MHNRNLAHVTYGAEYRVMRDIKLANFNPQSIVKGYTLEDYT